MSRAGGRAGFLFYSIALLCVLGGCQDKQPPSGEHLPLASSGRAASSIFVFSPKRPALRYYLAKTAEDRCEVYTVEGDTVTPKLKTHCPLFLAVGERVRLSGRACMLESSPKREAPVICPADLIYAEREDYFRGKEGADAGAAPKTP